MAIRCVWLLLIATTLTVASAGDGGLTLEWVRRPVQDATGMLSRLSGVEHDLAGDLVTAPPLPITCCLVDATTVGLRQAIAHASGCWWALDARGRTVYSPGLGLPVNRVLPRQAMRHQLRSSSLVDRGDLEARLRPFMQPWLELRDAGLAHDPATGDWSATLDEAGHARLEELLTVVERPHARCPSRLGDPENPGPERRVGERLVADGWVALAVELARSARVSVAIGPALHARDPRQQRAIAPQAFDELPATLQAAGLHAAWVHGVLCLDLVAIIDRELPAQRRRLALFPVGHLVTRETDGELLAATVRRRVAPTIWAQSGTGLTYLARERVLLAGADVPTLHEILAALATLDAFGLHAGLAELDARAAARSER